MTLQDRQKIIQQNYQAQYLRKCFIEEQMAAFKEEVQKIEIAMHQQQANLLLLAELKAEEEAKLKTEEEKTDGGEKALDGRECKADPVGVSNSEGE